MRRLALALWLAGTATAAAHTSGTTGFATVQVSGQSIRYTLVIGTDALGPAGLAASTVPALVARLVRIDADGAPCAALPQEATPSGPERANLFVVVLYACAGTVRRLTLTDDLFDRLGPNHHTLATVEWPGGQQQVAFEPASRAVTLDIPQPPAASRLPWLAGGGALLVALVAALWLAWRRRR